MVPVGKNHEENGHEDLEEEVCTERTQFRKSENHTLYELRNEEIHQIFRASLAFHTYLTDGCRI